MTNPTNDERIERLRMDHASLTAFDPDTPKGTYDNADVSAALSELESLKGERDRLRAALNQSYAEDWTASLCDRLNSIVRENTQLGLQECSDGRSASDLINELHWRINRLVRVAGGPAALQPEVKDATR